MKIDFDSLIYKKEKTAKNHENNYEYVGYIKNSFLMKKRQENITKEHSKNKLKYKIDLIKPNTLKNNKLKNRTINQILFTHLNSGNYVFKFYDPSKEKPKKMIRQWLNSYYILTAKLDEKIIGFLVGFRFTHQIFEVKYLEINKDYHNYGIGNNIILTAQKLAKKGKHKYLGLFVEPYNKALNFYKKIGFFQAGFIANYYSWNTPSLFMIKQINKD